MNKAAITKLERRAYMDNRKDRPQIAGAFVRLGKTCITNGIWGVMYHDKLEWLDHLALEESEYFPIERIFPGANDLTKVEYIPELTAKHKYVKISNSYFNRTYINNLLAAVDKPVEFYVDNKRLEYLIIRAKNADALLCPVLTERLVIDGDYADDRD